MPPGCAEARAIRSAIDPGGNCCWPTGSGASAARGDTSVCRAVAADEATGIAGERIMSRGGGAGRELVRLLLVEECTGVVAIPSSSEMEELRLDSHVAADRPAKMFMSAGISVVDGVCGDRSARAGTAVEVNCGASSCGGELAFSRSYTCSSLTCGEVSASASRCAYTHRSSCQPCVNRRAHARKLPPHRELADLLGQWRAIRLHFALCKFILGCPHSIRRRLP